MGFLQLAIGYDKVISQGKSSFRLTDMDNLDVTQKEEEANQFASDWLIISDALQPFLKQSQAMVALWRVIDRFAEEQKGHPGIVFGRLYQMGVLPYQNLRGLLVRVILLLQGMITFEVEVLIN
jgi:hypothetical protein